MSYECSPLFPRNARKTYELIEITFSLIVLSFLDEMFQDYGSESSKIARVYYDQDTVIYFPWVGIRVLE